jgi:hypothetical protein
MQVLVVGKDEENKKELSPPQIEISKFSDSEEEPDSQRVLVVN